MKSLPLAAAALLLGTSASALTPSTAPSAAPAVAKPAYVPAAAPASGAGDEAGLETTSAVIGEAADAQADPDLDLAVDPDEEEAKLAGMGGPEEPLDVAPAPEAVAAADPAPRPAARPYPACRPGPGDDNCIQLYEPGVRVALARRTGSIGEAATAMGGPYEPADSVAGTETAMAGDGIVDPGMGEVAGDEEPVAI